MNKPYENEHNEAIAVEAVIKGRTDRDLAKWQRGIITTNEFIYALQVAQAEAVEVVKNGTPDQPAI